MLHPLFLFALVAAGVCGKKTDQTTTQTSGGAIAPGANVQVADVTLGRSLSADKRVADQTASLLITGMTGEAA